MSLLRPAHHDDPLGPHLLGREDPEHTAAKSYLNGDDPILALRKATVFAAYKIGERGASLGFLPEDELHRLFPTYGV